MRLGIIAFFVSLLGRSGSSVPSADDVMLVDPAAFLFWLGIGLVLWLLASIMEFVFLESVRTTTVRIRRYASTNLWEGTQLFLFRVGLLLAFVVLLFGPLLYMTRDGGEPWLFDRYPPLFLMYLLLSSLVYAILDHVTIRFVAPIMLLQDRTILSAWRRFLPTFTANWAEYVVYLVVVFFLMLIAVIGAWMVILFGGMVLFIPLVIAVGLLESAGTLGLLVAVLLGIVGVVAFVLFGLLVWTPVVTYFRYYTLLLLGDTDDELDLIPDQRAAIRGLRTGTPSSAKQGTNVDSARGDTRWTGDDRSELADIDEYDPWAEEPENSSETDTADDESNDMAGDELHDIDDYDPFADYDPWDDPEDENDGDGRNQ